MAAAISSSANGRVASSTGHHLHSLSLSRTNCPQPGANSSPPLWCNFHFSLPFALCTFFLLPSPSFFLFFPLRLWCLPITKSSSGLSSQIGRIKFGSARLNTLWMKEQQQQEQQQQSLVHQRLANHHRSNRWNANWQIKLESTEHRAGGGK